MQLNPEHVHVWTCTFSPVVRLMVGWVWQTWHKAGCPPCEHWALPHLLEFVFFYFTQYQQALAEDTFSGDFPVLPVLLDPLETGTHPIKSPSSEPKCNVAVAGCVPPLLRELIFLFNLPCPFSPFSIPNSGLSPLFNRASGLESVFSLGLGYNPLGRGGPRCNSLFTKGAVETEEEVWMMAGWKWMVAFLTALDGRNEAQGYLRKLAFLIFAWMTQ